MPRLSLFPADLEHVVNHTRDLWQAMRGERLFITGGTGFFGHWLLESFLWANDRLKLDARAVVLTRNPAAFRAKSPQIALHPAIQCQAGDVRDFVFPGGGFAHVIHGATDASSQLNDQRPAEMFETIAGGTQRTLEFAAARRASNFLLISSGAVYGPQPVGVEHLVEDSPVAETVGSVSAYGEGKRLAEMLAVTAHRESGLNAKIARCFAFVGPNLPLDIHFAIGNFLRDALKGNAIEIRGDGTPYRSYLYAADLAVWLWTILFQGQACRPYNVGSDQGLSIAEVARIVAQLPDRASEVHQQRQPDPTKRPVRYVPSIDRARRELGLELRVPLVDALQRTFAWCRQHEGLRAAG